MGVDGLGRDEGMEQDCLDRGDEARSEERMIEQEAYDRFEVCGV